MKKLILLWILILTFQIFAQNKNVALKFDEFDYPLYLSSYYYDSYNYYYDSRESFFNRKKISFYDRIIRFAEELTKRKESTAYVIYYNQRKGKYPLDKGKTESQEAVRILMNKPEYTWYSNSKFPISSDQIITIDGGFRETPTLEFWIVPKDAEPPKSSPTFSISETAVCPEINVAGDAYRKDRSQPIKFSVAIKDQSPDSKLDLEWNVSAGKIVKGQSTNKIEVDLSETSDKFISASVTVKGLHPECLNHKFASTEVGFFPYKFDEFSQIPFSDLAGRLDSFINFINDEPSSVGYIIIYGSRNANKKDTVRMRMIISDHLRYRHFPQERVLIVDGGFREEMMIEFYLVPAGVASPKPTPTLDNRFVVEPKKAATKRKKTSK